MNPNMHLTGWKMLHHYSVWFLSEVCDLTFSVNSHFSGMRWGEVGETIWIAWLLGLILFHLSVRIVSLFSVSSIWTVSLSSWIVPLSRDNFVNFQCELYLNSVTFLFELCHFSVSVLSELWLNAIWTLSLFSLNSILRASPFCLNAVWSGSLFSLNLVWVRGMPRQKCSFPPSLFSDSLCCEKARKECKNLRERHWVMWVHLYQWLGQVLTEWMLVNMFPFLLTFIKRKRNLV